MKNRTEIPLSTETFIKITNAIMGNIFVADINGDVFFANQHCADTFDATVEELLTFNVHDMEDKGIIDRQAATSTSLLTEKPVIRYVKTRNNVGMLIHCEPVFDEDGTLEMVVAFSHEEHDFEKFVEQIETEKTHLQTALQYLNQTKESKWFVSSENPKMQELYDLALLASHSDSTISIYGESGTGKEVLARFIHRNSLRCSTAFIPVNCAAIPGELMESEFFGYAGGAFTGAAQGGKAGLFEIANKGTLFLDEIGELPLSMQSKLLRVLESGEIRRIGSGKLIQTDVRIITATNRNLWELVQERKFREDLFYRLNVVPLKLPPLRQRPEDIIPLSNYLLTQLNHKYRTRRILSEDAKRQLQHYDWPGNVRELKNVLERLMVVTKGHTLHIGNDLGFSDPSSSLNQFNENPSLTDSGVRSGQDTPLSGDPGTYRCFPKKDSAFSEAQPAAGAATGEELFRYGSTLKAAVSNFQQAYLNKVIEQCGGNMTAAARTLGIHRSNLYKLIGKNK